MPGGGPSLNGPVDVREVAGPHAEIDRGRLERLIAEESARFEREHPHSRALFERLATHFSTAFR